MLTETVAATRPLRRLLRALPRLHGGPESFFHALFYVYLVLALLTFAFLVPPFQKNDEPSHFYRTVSITNLDFFCEKDAAGRYYTSIKRKYLELPAVLGAEEIYFSPEAKFSLDRLGADFSDPKYRQKAPAYDICNLAVPGYLPNAAGLLLGKPFQTPLVAFFAGRVTGALFFVACLILALRTVPGRFSPVVYFYAALPMLLHQVTSFSYDVVQLALFPLLFAYVTKFLVEERPVDRRELLLFMGMLWLTLAIKSFAYYGVLLFYFLIPPRRVAGDRWGYLRLTGAFLAVTAVSIGLFEVVYLSRSGLAGEHAGPVDPPQQVRFVLQHPLDFLQACYNTVRLDGDNLLRQAVGVFGWVGFEINFLVIYLFVLLSGLLAYHIVQRDETLLHPLQLSLLWAGLLVTVASLFFSLYVVWSPVGAPTVEGLQGRYFLGLIPFTLLGASQTAHLVGRTRAVNLAVLLLAAILLASIFLSVLNRYY